MTTLIKLLQHLHRHIILTTIFIAYHLPLFSAHNISIYRNTNGLCSNSIEYICKDSSGIMYFCSMAGLSVFDGSTFTTYNSTNIKNFPNRIKQILPINKYQMLILSDNRKLYVWDKLYNSIKELEIDNEKITDISSIVYGENDELFISCYNGTIWHSDSLSIAINKGRSVTTKNICKVLPSIKSLYVTNETIYAATSKDMLYKIKNDKKGYDIDSLSINDPKSSVNTIFEFNSYLLVGSNSGLYLFDISENGDKKHIRNYLRKETITALGVYNGKLYIGTEGKGLFFMDISELGKKNEPYKDNNLILSDRFRFVTSINTSKDGVWIGSWLEGTLRLHLQNDMYKQVTARPEVNDYNTFSNIIWDSWQSENDSILYLGTNGKGLCRYKYGDKNFHEVDTIFTRLFTLFKDSTSRYLYVGTWKTGLHKYDLEQGKYVPIGFPNMKGDRVFTISRYDKENLFIGLQSRGLWLYNDIKETVSRIDMGKNSEFLNIRDVKQCPYGKGYWIATYNNGLYYIELDKDHSVRTLKHYDDFNSFYRLKSITISGKEELLVSTTDGILKLEINENGVCTLKKKLLKGYLVNDTRIINDSTIMAATHTGVVKLINDEKNFSFRDNDIFYKLKPTTDNKLMLCGTSGLWITDNNFHNMYGSKAYIKSLNVNGERVLAGDSTTKRLKYDIVYADTLYLEADDKNISFQLSAIKSFPEMWDKIYYKISGIDKKWNTLDNYFTSITYNNIPAGKYSLMVRLNTTENRDGEKILTILKKEYWYLSETAYFIYAILFVLFFIALSYYMKRNYARKVKYNMLIMEKKKEKELTEQKIRFFTNVSHDIKSPLTLILSPISDLLNSKSMPEEFIPRLKSMQINGEHLIRKVNRVLNFKDVENETEPVKTEDYLAKNMLFEIIVPFKEYAQSKGLNLSISFSCNLNEHIVIRTDRSKIESVLENIISNAIKYTPENGEVRINCYLKEDNRISISIDDTGKGIPEEVRPYIFDRYYRVSNEMEGSGIGLYLVKHYLELLNGTIRIEPKEEKGTRFVIELPLPDNCHSSISTGMEDNTEDGNNTTNCVLIVDDNKEIRELLKDALKNKYKVFEATNGNMAIEIMNREIPDIILSDYMMPDMNGLELCQNVKKNVLTSHIPFIMLSAYSSDDIRKKCWENGVDLFEEKPFNVQVLRIKIANIIHNRKLLKHSFRIAMPNSVQEENGTKYNPEETFLIEINDIIEKNKDNSRFMAQDLADNMNIGYDQLYRKLKSISGLSINSYIRTYRLNVAAMMLKSGNYNITEVLYSVGFNNPSYFTKCFKKQFGVLPSEYVETEEEQQ